MAYQQSSKGQDSSARSQGKESSAQSLISEETRSPQDANLKLHPMQQLQRNLGNRAVQRLIESAKITAQRESFGSYHDREDTDLADGFEEQLAQRQGMGSSLPENARAFLEPRLGVDLSAVRIHTDGQSHQLADAVNAKAFTTGTDIFFREGEYSPGSSEGMRLLAHEVTHVLQQSLGPVAGNPIEGSGVSVSDPSDSFEREADQVASEVMSHSTATASSGQTMANSASSDTSVQREEEEGDSLWGAITSTALPFAGQALDALSGVKGFGGGMFGPLEMMSGLKEGGTMGNLEAMAGGMETVGGLAEMAVPLLGEGGMAAAGAEALAPLGGVGAVLGAGIGGYKLGSVAAEVSDKYGKNASLFGTNEAGNARSNMDMAADWGVNVSNFVGGGVLGDIAGGATSALTGIVTTPMALESAGINTAMDWLLGTKDSED